jgi:hypothetical protein
LVRDGLTGRSVQAFGDIIKIGWKKAGVVVERCGGG